MTDTRTLPATKPQPSRWVQTDRASHEAWARLSASNPKAGALLHLLAARVGDNNAVVVSHKTLAELLGVRSITTIKTAITALVSGNWIEVRRIGENGTVNAYVLNDRVVWSGPREGLRYSLFSATVVVSDSEQPDRDTLGKQEPLRRLPPIGERQLPHGDGLPPPSQPFLDGIEPDLPATEQQNLDPVMQEELSQLVIGLGNRLRAPDASPPDDATDI